MINNKINNDRSGCGLWGERTGFIVDHNTRHLGYHTTTDHSTPSRLTDKYSYAIKPVSPSQTTIQPMHNLTLEKIDTAASGL